MSIPAALIIENLNTAVLLLDRELRIRALNPSAEMMLAVSARQAKGQPLSAFLEDRPDLLALMARTLSEGHPVTERERPLRLSGGQVLTVDYTLTPLLDAPEKTLLVELFQVDRHLRIAREEHLLHQNEAMSAIIRGLAHEIKNPLGGLRGAAQLLERELEDPDLKEYTRIIVEEADRLRNLVDRMLSPNHRSRKRPVNLHEALEHVRRLLQAEAPAHIRWITDYDPSIPECFADAEQIIQALINIVRNAIQALSQEPGTIRLRTRILRRFTLAGRFHRLAARIDIIDSGPGIPEGMVGQVFYPMVSQNPKGTGLGLPIAQTLIKQHGGIIECSSRPGETVFSIFLPLEES
ncbi:MAG: nitrogen regulation protein NR(II) [Gammaproteobacteria bacterium]|nr:MAG: nitrogen regulation protein NR(II) [Gammaproteobacteria bacterium]